MTTFSSTLKLVKNTLLCIIFSALFSVFGNLVKRALSCLIYYYMKHDVLLLYICTLSYCLFLCSELTSADEQTSNELMSCKNQCPKILAVCGHRCSSNCHAGPCPSPELCNRKSAVRCPCRRKKRVSHPWFYSKVSQHWGIVSICS